MLLSRWVFVFGGLGLLDLSYIDLVLGPRVQHFAGVSGAAPVLAMPDPVPALAPTAGGAATSPAPQPVAPQPVAPPPAALADGRVGPPGQTWWIVNFPETGQVTLSEDAEQQLSQIALRFASSHDVHVNVVGHADERGEGELNEKIGELRAHAVLAALVRAGFRPEQVRIGSSGEAAPAVLGSNQEAWAANRRAELEVVTVPRTRKTGGNIP
jgi:peptidoglycan-associated lipoprotein